MKILHINTRDYGGAAIAAIRLHKALLDEGVDSSMLFLEQSETDIPAAFGFRGKGKIHSSYLSRKAVSFKNKILQAFSKSQKNEKKLKNREKSLKMFSFNPSDYDVFSHPAYREADVIHLHWCARFFDFKSFQSLRKPIVWTFHDMNPFTGGCHFSNGCHKYERECRNCPQLAGTKDPDVAWMDQKYKKKYLEGVSLIPAAPSYWMKSCAERSALFGRFKSYCIPNCVDTDVFKPLNKAFCREVLNWPVDKTILLFVSEEISNPRKGFDLLLEALALINIPDFFICVIGVTGITAKDIPGINYQGKINDEKLMAVAYSAADAVVIPSREDNLPNTMLESLACGTPVIAFKTGGIPEVITNGVNGILSEDLTSVSLAESISWFSKNSGLFIESEITNDAVKSFSPQGQANSYYELYKELLS